MPAIPTETPATFNMVNLVATSPLAPAAPPTSTPGPKGVSLSSRAAADPEATCDSTAADICLAVLGVTIFVLLILLHFVWKKSRTARALSKEFKVIRGANKALEKRVHKLTFNELAGKKMESIEGHEEQLRVPYRAPPPDFKRMKKAAKLDREGKEMEHGPTIEDVRWASRNMWSPGEKEEEEEKDMDSRTRLRGRPEIPRGGRAMNERWLTGDGHGRPINTEGFHDVPLTGGGGPTGQSHTGGGMSNRI